MNHPELGWTVFLRSLFRQTGCQRWLVRLCLLLCGCCGAGLPFPVAGDTVQEAAQSKPNLPQELQEGTELETTLGEKETHSFQIKIKAGDFLHVAAKPTRPDLVFELAAADGNTITRVEQKSYQTRHRLHFVAQQEGTYTFTILRNKEAQKTNSYKMQVLALHPLSSRDRTLITATEKFDQGQTLYFQAKKESFEKAIPIFQETLKLFEDIGDTGNVGVSYNFLGDCYGNLNQLDKAVESFQKAAGQYEKIRDKENLAPTFANIFHIYNLFDEHKKGLPYSEKAIALYRELGDTERVAVSLLELGVACNRLGDKQKALAVYLEALPILKAKENHPGYPALLNNIGRVYYDVGEKQKALDYYYESLNLQPNYALMPKASVLGNIAVLYTEFGDYAQALPVYEKALSFVNQTSDINAKLSILLNQGKNYYFLRDFTKAKEVFQSALDTALTIGNRAIQARMYLELGKLEETAHNFSLAESHYQKTLALAQSLGNKSIQGYATANLGRLQAKQGQPQSGLKLLEQAYQMGVELSAPQLQFQILFEMGKIESSQGQWPEAQAHLEEAIRLIESQRTKVVSQSLRTSFFSKVLDYYELYVDVLMERHRLNPSAGFDRKAFTVAETARARSLLDQLTESQIDLRSSVDPALFAEEQNVTALMQALSDRLVRLKAAKAKPETLTQAENDFAELGTQLGLIQTKIRQNNRQYAALTQPKPLSLEEIQKQLLPSDTLLLEYFLGEKHSYVWAVTQTSIHSFQLPPMAEITQAARETSRLLSHASQKQRNLTKMESGSGKGDEKEALKAIQHLSRLILQPVAEKLGKKRLLVVADGALQLVPFAALAEPGPAKSYRPLLENHEIAFLPSASTLAVLRQELQGRKPAPQWMALVADPVFSEHDPRVFRTATQADKIPQPAQVKSSSGTAEVNRILVRPEEKNGGFPTSLTISRLPGTRQEAQAITSIFGRKNTFLALDFAANRELVTKAEFGQHRIIHFATHGFVNPEHPELSGLVLNLVDQQGQEQNGFLLMQDIYQMKLKADLVVLSACETGLGKEYRGEGLVGLTRGFMYAGAPRVVVSLWSINDRATAKLMEHFYLALHKEGKSAAAALRQAQLAISRDKRWKAPYFWAAFQLQGEFK
ncbi:MAG: CHAT domain-containing protein [Blastocatellia bacterium]|nr:CHAT domain-containing protein [Blastocatellia bacterium]